MIVRQESDGLWTIHIDLAAAHQVSKHLSPDLYRLKGEIVTLVRHPDGSLGLTDEVATNMPPLHVSESDAERYVNHLIFKTLNIADARARPQNWYVAIVRAPALSKARGERATPRRARERRARRDGAPSKSTTLTMLARWVMSGDRATGEIAADALESGGHQEAADDVRLWMKEESPYESRDGLFRRIRSELNGRMLSKGTWRISKGARGVAARHYVAIYEPSHRTLQGKDAPRALLWERTIYKEGPPSWRLWGTYKLREFSGSLKKMLDIMGSDIRSESASPERRAEIRSRRWRAGF